MSDIAVDPTTARRNRFTAGALPQQLMSPKLGRCSMTIFEIKQKSNGAVLWTGAALDATSALDAMAREAGYIDYAALPADIRAAGPIASRID
ncbi:hypothetical protein G3T14_04595 [Methylobacterium sp. BTF04]|uniref:hypothetical protein n=1 Tax=Methylobacterium sp. BTF04 TaxID=2708300 RepID=UPI0013D7ADA2|nr:hypothetical protein [Methylobacterium sp. BTF04]NEU11403.1 hypothetical protein [Methylobacterium sp. BTF04]